MIVEVKWAAVRYYRSKKENWEHILFKLESIVMFVHSVIGLLVLTKR